MARPEPYWSRYLPSWREKNLSSPVIKNIQKSLNSSTLTSGLPCEGCTWSCDHCPYK